MRVSDLMTRDIVILPGHAPVVEAVMLLIERRISSVIVRPADPDASWGIVTHRDIVAAVAAGGHEPSRIRVDSLMRPAFLLVDPSLNVGFASRLMRRFRVRHLLVLEGSQPVGILSYHDVLNLFTLLRRVAFFERLSVEDLAALLNLAELRRCPSGTILIKEGETSRDLFILEEGKLVVSTRRAGRIARIDAGEMFGEMELFGGKRSATVLALRDSRVLAIDGERFLRLALRREHLGTIVFESMSRVLSNRLRRANRYLFLRGIWAHRAYVWRTAFIVAGVFLILVFGVATVSERPSFCQSCHFMQPYHASWATSAHNKIKCTTCHWSYGLKGAVRGKITGLAMVVRYATQTYDPKPRAEVADDLCLRSGCHDGVVATDRYRDPGGGNVNFPHAKHLSKLAGIGVPTCTSCHNHRGQSDHFSVLPSTCSLCHFPESGLGMTPCRGCHDFQSSGGNSSSPIRLDHSAYTQDAICVSCHSDAFGGTVEIQASRCTECHVNADTLSVLDMHLVHVRDESIDCFECHSEIEHPSKELASLFAECEGCHESAHAGQERMYVGEGGSGIAGRPSLMHYFQVKCIACHGFEHAKGSSGSPGEGNDACSSCHETDVKEKVRTWEITLDQLRERVENGLERFESRAGSPSTADDSTAWRLYEEARRNYDFVTADAAASMHNYRYAQDLLRASEENLTEAMDLISGKRGER